MVIPPLVERGEIEAFVTLGNGLIQDRIEAMVGEGNLLACLVEWGGSNVGPGELIRDSEGGYVVGELDGMLTERARRLAKALKPIGTTRITDNVRGMIWTKLQVNSTFTGLSAVSGLRYGGVAEQGPEAVYALWEEGVQVARAQGLELGEMHDVHAYEFGPEGLAQMMRHMANVRPSMLQDLDAGRETEVDVVNGGVASKGRELGIPTPHNDAVVELVHSMERGERAPDPKIPRLRQRGADHERDRELNPGRHVGGRMHPLAAAVEAVVGELARDQHVQGDEADRLRGHAHEPEHAGVDEAVPARAREVDREPQDQAEGDEPGAGDQPGAAVALHHVGAELARGQQVEGDEPDQEDSEAHAAVGQGLQDELKHWGRSLSQSSMTCGTNRDRLLVTSPVDSRMPSPAGSMSTVHTPSTGWLPS